MFAKVVLTGVFFSLCSFNKVSGLTCLSCEAVTNIKGCLGTVTCKDNEEECFLDYTVISESRAVFTAGCRAKLVCDLVASAVGKRTVQKRAGVQCAECCSGQPDNSTGAPCNWHLCNQKASYPTMCAICDSIGDYNLCSVSQQCPSNEICEIRMKVIGGHIVYELGCEQKTSCDLYLSAYHNSLGKRSDHGAIAVCAACCTGRNCNKDNCFELRKRQKCIDPAICGP